MIRWIFHGLPTKLCVHKLYLILGPYLSQPFCMCRRLLGSWSRGIFVGLRVEYEFDLSSISTELDPTQTKLNSRGNQFEPNLHMTLTLVAPQILIVYG